MSNFFFSQDTGEAYRCSDINTIKATISQETTYSLDTANLTHNNIGVFASMGLSVMFTATITGIKKPVSIGRVEFEPKTTRVTVEESAFFTSMVESGDSESVTTLVSLLDRLKKSLALKDNAETHPDMFAYTEKEQRFCSQRIEKLKAILANVSETSQDMTFAEYAETEGAEPQELAQIIETYINSRYVEFKYLEADDGCDYDPLDDEEDKSLCGSCGARKAEQEGLCEQAEVETGLKPVDHDPDYAPQPEEYLKLGTEEQTVTMLDA